MKLISHIGTLRLIALAVVIIAGARARAGTIYLAIDGRAGAAGTEQAPPATMPDAVGRAPENVFRGCRAWQNSDDGWDLWMAPQPVRIEDCFAFRNGYNLWKIEGFDGDGNGIKLGGNYVRGAHVALRCVSIENPLHGFDQNHNTAGLTIEDCVATRCGKGFNLPEVPRTGQDVLRRNTSFGCPNVLEKHMIMQENRWYPEIATGNVGPPPRPGYRATTGAGTAPTTQEAPLYIPAATQGAHGE